MTNKDVAQKVVDRIVEMIDSGESLPWVKPWNKSANTITVVDGVKVVTITPSAWNRSGVPYKGCNVYLPNGEYITFNQCKAEGGTIKKGAKGFPIVYWNFVKKKKTNDDGTESEEMIPVLKYYVVFRVEDCDGIAQKHSPEPYTVEIPITHVEAADTADATLNEVAEAIANDYIANAGNGFHVVKEMGGNKACYYPAMDYVTVPNRVQFAEMEEYYSTLFHELAHSTGHSTRLNRFTGSAAHAAFGSVEYSKEELVAEATAATMLNALGMESGNSLRNSAAYIKSWANHIKNDPLMYISAMTKAQAAFDMIIGNKTTNV